MNNYINDLLWRLAIIGLFLLTAIMVILFPLSVLIWIFIGINPAIWACERFVDLIN